MPKKVKENKLMKALIMVVFLVLSIPTYIIIQYILFGMSLKDLGATPGQIRLEFNPVFLLFVFFYWFIVANVHKWAKKRYKNKAEWDDW